MESKRTFVHEMTAAVDLGDRARIIECIVDNAIDDIVNLVYVKYKSGHEPVQPPNDRFKEELRLSLLDKIG